MCASITDVPHREESCRPIRAVLERVADKWSLLIIFTLCSGALRFNELRRRISGISQRMLTLTLRELERDGLVTRTVTPSVPPRVDYELTALGTSLLGPVQTLVNWALENQSEMNAARQAFDHRRPEIAPTLSLRSGRSPSTTAKS